MLMCQLFHWAETWWLGEGGTMRGLDAANEPLTTGYDFKKGQRTRERVRSRVLSRITVKLASNHQQLMEEADV